MSTPVVDPHWGWWIIWYFYLGGIAAGAYFLATLAELFGAEQDRQQTRVGYLLAAPLMGICGILLIADLSKPTRFWHMLLDHESWYPHLKFWSPMSIGAWAVLLFGLISFVSLIGAMAEAGWLGLGRFQVLAKRLHRGFWGRAFDLVGITSGFFVASYTGVLLTATNQPVWSDSPWIGALFLASSAGTGLAAIKLFSSRMQPLSKNDRQNQVDQTGRGADMELAKSNPHSPLETVEQAAWALEIVAATLFLHSLGTTTLQALARYGLAIPFLGGAIGLGIFVPWFLRWRPRRWKNVASTVAAMSVLAGGFLLRYSVLSAPHAVRPSAVTDAVGDAVLAGQFISEGRGTRFREIK